MDNLPLIFHRTEAQLDRLDFYFNDLLGGAIFTLACLVTVRLIIRALADSWFGRKNGSIVSGVMEAITMIFIVSTAHKNPSVVITSLAWSAALFRQFLVYFRGG